MGLINTSEGKGGYVGLITTTHLEHTPSDGGPSLDWLGEGNSRASQTFIPAGRVGTCILINK